MVMEAILEGLIDIQKKKIGKCNSAKEQYLRLEQLYSNKEQEAKVMELMLEDLTGLQKDKIGKCNSIEELSFNIYQLYSIQEQEAEDSSNKRLVHYPSEHEGNFPENYVCNAFKEICLLGIEDKTYYEFIECDENPCSISDSSLVDTKFEIMVF